MTLAERIKVAVVGAGPAGIYAADILAKSDLDVSIDLFERLPAPYGLVRYGVAPDHPRIKQIIVALYRILQRGDIHLYGNVEIGLDVTMEELRDHYDAAPVLTVINTAIQTARRIFQRITSYTVYRVALTINIMFLVVLSSIFLDFAPLSAIMIVVISLLDDVPIMTIAYDNTSIGKKPIRWNMKRIITVSAFLGFFSVIQSFGALLWAYGMEKHGLMGITSMGIVTSIVFVQVVTGGHLLVLVARARSWFFLKPFPAWQLWTTLLAMATIGVLLAGFGLFIPKVPWPVIGIILAYNIVWVFLMNLVKFGAEKIADHESNRMLHHRKIIHANQHVPEVDPSGQPTPAGVGKPVPPSTAPALVGAGVGVAGSSATSAPAAPAGGAGTATTAADSASVTASLGLTSAPTGTATPAADTTPSSGTTPSGPAAPTS